MPLYRVTVEKRLYLETEIEADSADEARDEAQYGHDCDWTDASGGRGGDEVEVIDVAEIDPDDTTGDVPPL